MQRMFQKVKKGKQKENYYSVFLFILSQTEHWPRLGIPFFTFKEKERRESSMKKGGGGERDLKKSKFANYLLGLICFSICSFQLFLELEL